MTIIGENIVSLQELIATPMNPPPAWARKWQTEAEHLLHLAHNAKDSEDHDELRKLDAEAKTLIKRREVE